MQSKTAFLAASLGALGAFAKTITVEVGSGGLTFNPASIVAAKGDVVEFEFYPLVRRLAHKWASAVSDINLL